VVYIITNTYPKLIIILFLVANITIIVDNTTALGSSPYDSGYDHGCDDTDISDPDDRYINQPEKVPSFHTDEFMNGYNDGFNACSSGDSSTSGSDSSNKGKLRVIVTFIEGPDRSVNDARVYIQEYPQYGIPVEQDL
jgi:hypothetical protein